MPGEPSAHEGHLNLSPGRPKRRFSTGVRCICCQQSAQIGDLPQAPLEWRGESAVTTHAKENRSERAADVLRLGDLVTPSRAYFSLPGDETRSGAQDLRRGLRHSARSNRPWSAPKDQGLSGTLASNGGEHRRLRRSAGTSALRAVRNASGEHLPDLRRTADPSGS